MSKCSDQGEVGNNLEGVDFLDQHVTWYELKADVAIKYIHFLSELDSITLATVPTPQQGCLESKQLSE